MDGIACALSKKCRKEKSEEIVKKMNQEQEEYKNIYENENNKNKPLHFLGYNNSEVLDLYYDTFKTDFECFQYQDDCESSFPSPSITTGWYVPSSGELVALQDKDNSLESKLNTKLIKVSDKTMDISATYWSSTERNNKNMYIVTYSKTAGSAGTGGVKTNTYTYRFFLGF